MRNECAIFIPARGGSKGLKNKNLKLFASKPLLFWSIQQAKNTKFKNHIYVSSDSKKILNYADKCSVNTIKRPKQISGDNSSTEEAIIHFLNTLKKKYNYIIFLQPTSPLRHSKDIEHSYNQIKQEKKNSLFSGNYFSDLLIWSKNKKLKSMNYDVKNRKRRQDHKGIIVENGSIYVFKSNYMLENQNRIDPESVSFYKMKTLQFLEIDDLNDFKLCEKVFINKLY